MTTTKPRPATKGTPTESARAEVARLAQAGRDLHEQIEAKERELVQAQKSGEYAKVAALREEISHMAGPQLDDIKQQQQQAALGLREAEIAEMRQKAAMLRQQCQERDKATAPLLAQLEELEGVSFDDLKDDPLFNSHPHWTNGVKPPRNNRESRRDYRSRTERDLAEAADLDRKAGQMEKELGR